MTTGGDGYVHLVGEWVGTWSAATQLALGEPAVFDEQTIRLAVRASAGGDAVRVRFSNAFGDGPLFIGRARVALSAGGSAVEEGSGRDLTFGGEAYCTIPPKSTAWSDPADFALRPLSELAVSIHLPGPAIAETSHFFALQTNHLNPPGPDATGDALLPDAIALPSWPYLTGIDVLATDGARSVVVLGDSIVDGAASTSDTNRRWTDLLAARLHEERTGPPLGVLNQGIIGNRLLAPSPPGREFHGEAGLFRFDDDVLGQTGVAYVVVLFGVNDLGFPGPVTSVQEQVGAEELIDGHRRLVARAHEAGITAIGSTMTPFEYADSGVGFHTAEKEAVRRQVNDWIRTGGAYDGVIDFDAALRDPAAPARLAHAYDSGDHLHPGDAGHQAMADAIDLTLFG